MADHCKQNGCVECSVNSCRFHDRGDRCLLGKIRIASVPGQSTGKAEDESMCASYSCRGDC